MTLAFPDWLNDALLWLITVHYGSASLLEAVWTAAAVVGLLTTIWLWRQSVLDRDALERATDFRPGGPRAIVAQGNARDNMYELVVEAFLVLVGVIALLTPSARTVPSAYGIILALGATGIAVLLTVGAVQNHRDRRRFLAQIRRLAGDNGRRDRRATDQGEETRT